ncbi:MULTISPECIES: hypothetical protein [Acetobacteraceae]|uniref:hypothetical protein n=1 Tax=Acetobacteraceae TaxID=433 RepID=UPI001D0C894E|nr:MULTISPECIES: hypothetical protein [Acetobacteraceae]MCQ0041173.1 hypothetical protein [Bombella sp.]MCT6813841.1 hypothetical protein [Bombella apis]MCT6819025.1 hypothetical protein [Bombella apis]MCT6844950.1 hypothetical protein [Bombella apis]
MAQKAFRVAEHATAPSSSAREHAGGVVVPFRQKLLSHHRHYLATWLIASEKMGILDASIESSPDQQTADPSLVVIWVRENADPAYLISLRGPYWVLTDCLRDNELGRYRTFSEALHTIRPVLPLHASA